MSEGMKNNKRAIAIIIIIFVITVIINSNCTNYRRVGTHVVIKSGIDDYRISVEHDTTKDLATATLVIKHLNRTDDGLYTCIASNKVRKRHLNYLYLRGRPRRQLNGQRGPAPVPINY